MFSQKPCLPVSIPQKRKRQSQPQSSVEGEQYDEDDGTIHGIDLQDCNNQIENGDDDESDDDDNDGSEMEMDAAKYLFVVREEARRLPDIWTSTKIIQNDTKQTTLVSTSRVQTSQQQELKRCNTSTTNNKSMGSIASLEYLISYRTKIHPPPTRNHIPRETRKWVDFTLSEFSQLRQYLEQCKGNPNDYQSKQRQPVPPMKDFMSWFVFCIGRHHGYPKEVVANASATTCATLVPAWESSLPTNGDGYAPSTHLVLQMDQVMVRRVLCHLTNYIDRVADRGNGQQRGCYLWVYALLARLERPIHRDDAVTLYTLLKRLTRLRHEISVPTLSTGQIDSQPPSEHDETPTSDVRSDMNPNGNDSNMNPNGNDSNDNAVDLAIGCQYLATLNTLIAIIGVYFEQGGSYALVMQVSSPV